MSEQVSSPPRKPAFLDRKISLRWSLILIGIVVLAGLVLWAMKALECRSIATQAESELREAVARSAENVARAIAVVGNRLVVEEKYETLQDYVDNLVRAKPILFIAIVNRSGKAVVHTDRSLLRKKWKAPESDERTAVAWVPVMDFTENVGSVYVAMRVR